MSVIGASTIYGLTWLVVLIIPMLAVVQAISAEVAAVSRKGLEDCVRHRYGRFWGLVALVAVVSVTIITLAADLEGGAAALQVLTHLDYRWFILPFAAATAVLLVFGHYAQIENILKYISLVFFAYVASAIIAKPNWGDVLRNVFLPHWTWNAAYTSGAVAMLGTTLTAYAYVWETIEVAEERPPLRRLGLVQAEAALGMVFAGIVFFFTVVATGATLGVHHKDVQTAQDAAIALAPLAGPFASVLFGTGLLASALLAVPVLAGTNAYVMAEMFGWRKSLDRDFAHARRFYWAMLISLAIGTAVAYAGVSPIKLLFLASIAGGIGTPITLTLMLLVAGDSKVMGKRRRAPPALLIAGWAANAVIIGACALYFYQLLTGTGS
ncbi:MAG: divalent metal cation transporter [Candidatus Eremiobacteraeota bacterium]|nr:divalent metal cation transporter [Candidatus Eremiobacteraeota bacterium]MBV9646742.1 divalent metal cation transporter [Candidatus Eremiobacteraeota bacterium]